MEVATLWKEDPQLGHSVAVLPALPQDAAFAGLWAARFPSLELLRTPAEALAWKPDVVVAIDFPPDPPGFSSPS